MDKILKDQSGKIWKDINGNILKERGFSETPIQDGLTFWGNSQVENLTVVDGLVSEAYDIRDTEHNWSLKMTQSVVSYRPTYQSGVIQALQYDYLQTNTNSNCRSFFFVASHISGKAGFGRSSYPMFSTAYVGVFGAVGLGLYSGTTPTPQTYYSNNVKYINTSSPRTSSWKIINSISDMNLQTQQFKLGGFETYGADIKIKEWGWYDRVLNEKEVLYNINAMNAKYQIF